MSDELTPAVVANIGRPCEVCRLPNGQRFQTESEILRGDVWEEIGNRIGISKTSCRRHAENHMPEGSLARRDWFQKHGNETIAAGLVRKVEQLSLVPGAGQVTPVDIQNRFLVLERYATELLAKLDAQKDLRGALQVVTELRALTVALSTMNTRGVGLEETGGPEETEDVRELREKIVAQLLKERAAIANLECQSCGWRLQKPAS